MKYFLIYHINGRDEGVNYTYMTLNYTITDKTLKRVELRLAKALNVAKVTILSYKKVSD